MTLLRYDGSNCFAVPDGEPLGPVARSSAADLIEAVNYTVLG